MKNENEQDFHGKVDPSLDYSVIKKEFEKNGAAFLLPKEEFTGLTEEEKKIINPCGTFCGGCDDYGVVCDGCRNRDGRPIWYDMFQKPETCIFYTCTKEKGVVCCAECKELPCNHHFVFPDPNMPEEIKQFWFRMRMENFNKRNPQNEMEIKETFHENEEKFRKTK